MEDGDCSASLITSLDRTDMEQHCNMSPLQGPPEATTVSTTTTTTHSQPMFDPEVLGGDTCDLCQCCVNPGGFCSEKVAKAFASGATTPQELLYIAVCYGGWTVIFLQTYPAVDASRNVPSYHKIVGLVVFACCFGSWRLAKTTGPGSITAATIHKYDNYACDNVLYAPDRQCPTLQIRKIARSKYNRHTATHVPRFDHHCHVLNQAVGERNYRFFLVFLWVHATMCLYGSTTVWRLAWEQAVAASPELGSTRLVARPLSLGTALPRAVALFLEDPFTTSFALSVGAAGVALALFGGFHARLVLTGMTTNEYYKRKELSGESSSSAANRNGTTGSAKQKSGSNSWSSSSSGSKLVDEESVSIQTNKNSAANFYDRGIVSNILEVFSPRCDRPIGMKRD